MRMSVPLLFVIRYHWRLGVSAVEKNSGHSEARYFSKAHSELIRSVYIEPVDKAVVGEFFYHTHAHP